MYREPYLHRDTQSHVELVMGDSHSLGSPNLCGTSTENMMVWERPMRLYNAHAHIGTNFRLLMFSGWLSI